MQLNAAWHDAARRGGLISPVDAVGRNMVEDLSHRGFAFESAHELANAIARVTTGKQARCTVIYELEDPYECQEAVVSALEDGCFVVHLDRTGDRSADASALEADRLAMALEASVAARREQHRRVSDRLQETHGPATPLRLRLHQFIHGQLGPVTGAQQHTLQQMQRQVDRWLAIQGRTLVDLEAAAGPLNLSEAVASALHACRDAAIQAGVELVGFVEPDGHVDAPASTRAILLMLIERAIKRTPSGGAVRVDFEAGTELWLCIQDQEAGADAAPWPGLRLAAEWASLVDGRMVHEPTPRGRRIEVHLPSRRAQPAPL